MHRIAHCNHPLSISGHEFVLHSLAQIQDIWLAGCHRRCITISSSPATWSSPSGMFSHHHHQPLPPPSLSAALFSLLSIYPILIARPCLTNGDAPLASSLRFLSSLPLASSPSTSPASHGAHVWARSYRCCELHRAGKTRRQSLPRNAPRDQSCSLIPSSFVRRRRNAASTGQSKRPPVHPKALRVSQWGKPCVPSDQVLTFSLWLQPPMQVGGQVCSTVLVAS